VDRGPNGNDRRILGVEIVFETHSLTVDNERGIATGWLPGRLSERGRRLAAELGARRRDDRVAAVFTSDLARAVETAEIAFVGSGIPIHVDARLRECNYGTMNGMPVAQLEAERPRRIDVPFPEGESFRQAAERVCRFLDDLARSWDGTRVVVIGHTATRWALDQRVRGEPLEQLVTAPFDWREGWVYRLET
jgi:alpha-ribazole phosphatase/probable phosphoglycerate mutase